MTLRAKIPRSLNTFTDLYNPNGGKHLKFAVFSAFSISFLLFRSLMIRSIDEMPKGHYFDPDNKFSPKMIKME
jgi:hypothetical protein